MKDIFLTDGSVVSVCDMPGQRILVNGRERRFDYDKTFGPLWLRKDGTERKCQNPGKAVWQAFENWQKEIQQ
jgi:hypothetical protein